MDINKIQEQANEWLNKGRQSSTLIHEISVLTESRTKTATRLEIFKEARKKFGTYDPYDPYGYILIGSVELQETDKIMLEYVFDKMIEKRKEQLKTLFDQQEDTP